MKIRMAITGLLLTLLSSHAIGQFAASNRASDFGVPYFQLRVISTFDAENGTRLARLFTQIINENLTFLKNDTGYVAEVQFDIFVSDTEQEQAFSQTVNKMIFVDEYGETISAELTNTFEIDVPITKGKYDVRVTAMDRNSNSQFSQKANFEVRDDPEIANRVSVSDMLFFGTYEKNAAGDIVSFQPSLNNAFASDKEFIYSYFETYNPDPDGQTRVQYLIKDLNNIVVQQHQYLIESREKYVEHFIKLSRYYLDGNQYTLELSVQNKDHWVVKNTNFSFYWRFSPSTMQDLDTALREMKYIADDDSVKHYLKAPYEEKRGFFERFWHLRDPDPATQRNEIMEEYFRRVTFANANFSSANIGGWLTDRGRIFIKFGEPDEIERHPFEAESYPYQIWRYYSLQKIFLFIDRTGFGDYDLHPSYYYVEYD